MCGGPDPFQQASDALASVDPGPALGDIGESIDKNITQPVGKGLSEVDTFVNREIPGGWTLPAVIAVAYMTGYFDPSMLGTTTAGEGATGAGAGDMFAGYSSTGSAAGTAGTTVGAGYGTAGTGAAVFGTSEGALEAGNLAYSNALANGASVTEANAAADAATQSYMATGYQGAGLTTGAVDTALTEGLTTPLSQDAILKAAAQGALKGAAIGGIKGAVTGGDINDILKGAGYGAISGGAGGVAGNFASELGANALGTAVSGGVAGGATGALINGRDPLTGALIGGITSGAISGASELGGQLGTNANIDIANNSADPIGTLNASQNWTGPMANNIGAFAQELAAQGMSASDIATKLQSNYGIDQYAALNAAGMASAGQSGSSIADVLSQDYGTNMTGVDNPTAGPSIDLNNQTDAGKTVGKVIGNIAAPLAAGTILGATSNALYPSSGYGSSGSSSSGSSGDTTVYGALPTSLKSTSLAAAPVTQGDNMNLNQLKQLYPQLAGVDPRILNALTGRSTAPASYFNYGADQGGGTALMQGQAAKPSAGYPSIAANEKVGSENAATFMGDNISGGFNALASAGLKSLGATSSSPYAFKRGGKVQGALHIPEFKTGTTGHFVQGAGDGQSDDIPAMLADGEYVFDADTVAALGNGSSKAGALQLDKMRKAIRKHKRSASTDKIPPKAKSPLEYLKGQ
jgi:hypothetical protein